VDAATGDVLLDGRNLLAAQGASISSEWLTVHQNGRFQVTSERAQCILVIEKEGIYRRLSEDRFFDQVPCILVTGKGFPDIATRAMVHYVHTQTGLPVRGLADCNPFGVMVLHTYQGGGQHSGYGVPMEWVGLRPSQVEQLVRRSEENDDNTLLQQLPEQVFQQLTELDKKRLEDHLLKETHGWTNSSPNGDERYDELLGMRRYKVELEALHWLGMDFCATWLAQILEHEQNHDDDEGEDWLQVI
jgi:meiotic recombination protein SPO11